MKARPILFLLIFVLCMTGQHLQAQTQFVVTGARVTVLPSTRMQVSGDIRLHAAAAMDNSGEVLLSGDWENSSGGSGLINASPGTVEMNGGNQAITGAHVTDFQTLTLSGTGIKSLQQYARVLGVLNLNDRELATGNDTVEIVNSGVGAVTRSTGFYSNQPDGRMMRHTNASLWYDFPCGNTSGGGYYRPVSLNPASGVPASWAVGFLANDPGVNGFSSTNTDGSFCRLNNRYYHHADAVSGNVNADIRFYFDEVADGPFRVLANWRNAPRWENLGPVSLTSQTSPLLSFLTSTLLATFTTTPFGFGIPSPTVSLNPNPDTICPGDPVTFNASSGFGMYYFYNNGNLVQNSLSASWSSTQITANDRVSVMVSDTNSCAATDTVSVTVRTVASAAFTADTLGAPVVQFTDNSTGNPATWHWDFGDGNQSAVQNPSHTYANAGTYTVTLTVTNACGSDSATVTFTLHITRTLTELPHYEWSVFPNPSTGLVNVTWSGIGAGRLSLLDSYGRVLRYFPLHPNMTSLAADFRELPAGFYVLKLESEKGSELKRITLQ